MIFFEATVQEGGSWLPVESDLTLGQLVRRLDNHGGIISPSPFVRLVGSVSKGTSYNYFYAHAVRFQSGHEWDAINGWRGRRLQLSTFRTPSGPIDIIEDDTLPEGTIRIREGRAWEDYTIEEYDAKLREHLENMRRQHMGTASPNVPEVDSSTVDELHRVVMELLELSGPMTSQQEEVWPRLRAAATKAKNQDQRTS